MQRLIHKDIQCCGGEMLYAVRDLLGIADWYAGLAEPHLASAIARSAGCAVVVLAVTAGLNRLGFRLRL